MPAFIVWFVVAIVFNTYDIAPYSAGEQTFSIPYELVKPDSLNILCPVP